VIFHLLTSDVLRNNIKHHENDIGFGESCIGGVEVLEGQGGRIPWEFGFAPFGRGSDSQAGNGPGSAGFSMGVAGYVSQGESRG
jgi:hypothetical protein